MEELTQAADEIRQKFCKNQFDLCTIINGKSGKCSENCKYCAQSSFYPTDVESYPLLGTEELLKQAEYSSKRGVPRYSIVTSGKKLSSREVEQVCESIRQIKEPFQTAAKRSQTRSFSKNTIHGIIFIVNLHKIIVYILFMRKRRNDSDFQN